jgi:hypothetical protein
MTTMPSKPTASEAVVDAFILGLWQKQREQEWARERRMLARYGIDTATYSAMAAEQGHRCAICGASKPDLTGPDALHVDHDHASGLIRGLLCSRLRSGTWRSWTTKQTPIGEHHE